MNQQPISAVEGVISFRDHRVWYRIIQPVRGASLKENREESGKIPLLCLHGGPGIPHDYLGSQDSLPLERGLAHL